MIKPNKLVGLTEIEAEKKLVRSVDAWKFEQSIAFSHSLKSAVFAHVVIYRSASGMRYVLSLDANGIVKDARTDYKDRDAADQEYSIK